VLEKEENEMNLNTKRLAAAIAWMVVLGAFAGVPLLAQTDGKAKPSAESLISDAVSKAKAENKNILVHFGASW
jgi:hypothetical protein